MPEITNITTHRRGFLGRIAAGATALGLGGLVAPLEAAAARSRSAAREVSGNPEFEAWLNKITDPATKGPAVRHPLLRLKPGDVPIPGMGTDELLAKGVLIGVCNIALTFNSMKFATQMGMQAEAIKKEWVANLLPGVLVVPSGVIAINRSQEKGCAYCFAG